MDQLRSSIKRLRRKNASNRWYIPEQSLLTAMTEDAMNNALGKSGTPPHQHAETLQRILQSGRKIFAVLVLLDCQKYLANFIEADLLDDGKLPFKINTLSHSLEIPGEDAGDFEEKQWEFIAPVFRRGTLNRRLGESFVLPFTRDVRIGKGMFGTVYEAVLDPDHQVLSGDFFPGIKELGNLAILNHLKHPNIVELLGSFTCGDTHSIFFPLASDGNLDEVLSSDRPSALFTSSETMLIELAALSSAIEHVHDFSKQNMIDLELIGCHHDLRPRNILVSGSQLILADFGLSTIKPSSQNSETPFKHNSDDYLAPECEDWDDGFRAGKVHRSADIWSFGCIIAEVVTYLASGRDGVDEFRRSRKHKQNRNTAPSIDMFLEHERFNAWRHALGLENLENHLSRNEDHNLPDKDPMEQYDGILESLVRLREDLQGRLSRGPDSRHLDLSHLVRLQDELHCFLNHQQKNASQAYFRVSVLNSHEIPSDQFAADNAQTAGALSQEIRVRANIRNINNLLAAVSVDDGDAVEASSESATARFSGKTMHIDHSIIPNLVPIDDHHYGHGLLDDSDSNVVVSRPIWVEWRKYQHHGASEDTINKLYTRAARTADLLSQDKPESFRTLTCLGLFHKPARAAFGLVFEFPSPYPMDPAVATSSSNNMTDTLDKTKPMRGGNGNPTVTTLSQRLLVNNAPSDRQTRTAATVPDLDDRFKLAATLAASLFELHSVGWLHKSLTSSNVAFFPSSSLSPPSTRLEHSSLAEGDSIERSSNLIRRPYLVGFNHSRPDDPDAFTSGFAESDSRHYQHPTYLKAGVGYRPEFDYYSLGIILLEIGFWKPLAKVTKDWTGSFEERRQRLLTSRVPRLRQHMGREYSDAVRCCLAGDFEGGSSGSREGLLQFRERVVARLSRYFA
ncbi:hypothetical protein QQZ08_001888 [Neonectria magnoliae]|uniref:Protein kinase domain-containing protein n=1 Tax=Neonectria magnoliae TaxID=2732573 RepID=A0ABR1IEH1_9HYPO